MVLDQLLRTHNLIYLIPLGLYGLFVLLRRFGIELDLFAASDTAPRRGIVALLLPNPDLSGVTLVLTLAGWAAAGLAFNLYFPEPPFRGFRWLVFGVACGLGYATGVIGTALVGRLLPTEERSVSLADLVGQTAVSVGSWTSPRFGRAYLTDATGNRITVRCRWVGDLPLPRDGERITLVGFDPKARVFEAMR
ncbi:MAG: hypothetical protein KatS3mg115_0966 [Candidatus Poribacteria bacterium]|nr:MAG: hypothetical protein KatS3mg115_0966 [Candidatus Poribacteria bacterium]